MCTGIFHPNLTVIISYRALVYIVPPIMFAYNLHYCLSVLYYSFVYS